MAICRYQITGGVAYAENISTEQTQKKKGSWFQKQNEFSFRQKGFGQKKTKGQKGFVRIVCIYEIVVAESSCF